QVYVSTGDPQKLVPMFNLASARLYLLAQQDKAGDDDGAPVSSGDIEAVEADVVPDDQLVDIPRGKPTGIPFGPPLLPDEDQRIAPRWAVCEYVDLDDDLRDSEARRRAELNTTVVAGTSELGEELPDDEALLVRAPNDNTYLVYRLDKESSHENADV